MKDLENIFIFLLIFVVSIEDVAEPAPSIMSMIGGCLYTCSLVSISHAEARDILIV